MRYRSLCTWGKQRRETARCNKRRTQPSPGPPKPFRQVQGWVDSEMLAILLKSFSSSMEKRRAFDGEFYTRQEFQDYYGNQGQHRWNSAGHAWPIVAPGDDASVAPPAVALPIRMDARAGSSGDVTGPQNTMDVFTLTQLNQTTQIPSFGGSMCPFLWKCNCMPEPSTRST